MSLQYHKKVIQFTLKKMLYFDKRTIKDKGKDLRIQTYENCNYC